MPTPRMAPRARRAWCFAWQAAIAGGEEEGVRPQLQQLPGCRGVRRGFLKRPTRTSSYTIGSSGEAPYVPAPVPEIIANVEDARIPVERDKQQRGLAIRQGRPGDGDPVLFGGDDGAHLVL